MAKQDDYARYTIRVPAHLYASIEKAAQETERSVNAEIIQRLELAMSEDLWERQKFVDTLKFKQHIIDKQLHMLSEHLAKKALVEQMLVAEKSARAAEEMILQIFCLATIKHPETPPDLRDMAASILEQLKESPSDDVQEKWDLIAAIGDTDDVPPNWEENLSEDDKATLAEARKWVRD